MHAYHVAALELVNGLFDVLHATLVAHILGGEVGARTVLVDVFRGLTES